MSDIQVHRGASLLKKNILSSLGFISFAVSRFRSEQRLAEEFAMNYKMKVFVKKQGRKKLVNILLPGTKFNVIRLAGLLT